MTLDRQTLDSVARAVVSGSRRGPATFDQLADFLAGAMRGRLEAVGAPGRTRARRRHPRPPGLSRELFATLEKRVAKHLAAWGLRHDGTSAAG